MPFLRVVDGECRLPSAKDNTLNRSHDFSIVLHSNKTNDGSSIEYFKWAKWRNKVLTLLQPVSKLSAFNSDILASSGVGSFI